MQGYSYVAIAALVPLQLAKQLSILSQDFSLKFKSWFVLDTIKFPPHVTIWIAYVPTKNLPQICNESRRAIAQFPHFNIHINEEHVEKEGFVSLKIYKTKEITELHQSLLRQLNKWREGYLDQKYVQNFNNYPKEQQENLKQFGTRFAGKLFNPHVTIAMVNPEFVEEVKRIMPKINSSFEVCELILFKQVESGKSIEILERFPISEKK